jgi:hypothetical protein
MRRIHAVFQEEGGWIVARCLDVPLTIQRRSLVGGQKESADKLEHFKKFCGHLPKRERAVFLSSGFVSALSQVTSDMLRRQSLARTQKSSPQMATEFFKML